MNIIPETQGTKEGESQVPGQPPQLSETLSENKNVKKGLEMWLNG